MSILKEGYPFIFPSLAVGLVFLTVSCLINLLFLNIVCMILGILFIIFALFCMFFFRDPSVKITQGEGIILSPCNGTVMEVVEEGDEKVVRVFLSIFSVHLQRSPADGIVVDVAHKDGKFYAAWDARAQSENEQNIITIKSEEKVYIVRQIAGLVARRCVSWVKPGDSLRAGDKIGMIKFSSQVDTHLPKTAAVSVKPGDKTKAGITVMARN